VKKAPAGFGTVERRPTAVFVRVRLSSGRPRVEIGPPGMSDARVAAEVARLYARRDELERELVARRAKVEPTTGKLVTFRDLGEAWTSGDLARRYPDRVKAKKTADDDRWRLERHVYPRLGPKPLAAITADDCENVLSALPEMEPASRRHVAQLMSRVLSLAAFPVRAIAASPLPDGFLPAKGARKALTFLYPEEERRLLACTAVPLAWRVACGLLAREGFRGPSEAGALTWGDVDLDNGAIRLDENKTDEPRAWAMSRDTWLALKAWRLVLASRSSALVAPGARVIVGVRAKLGIDLEHGAQHFRAHLKTAGVARAELYERSKARQPIRLHDLRATFVTVSLAQGRTETWVTDRTGHKSSTQVSAYKRPARQVAELGLGALADMAATIPELAAVAHLVAHGAGGGGAMIEKRRVHEEGLEPPCLAAPEPKSGRGARTGRERAGIVVDLASRRAQKAATEAVSGAPVAHGVAHELAGLGVHAAALSALWDALDEEMLLGGAR